MTEFTKNYFENQINNTATGSLNHGAARLVKNYRDSIYHNYQINDFDNALVINDLPWESESKEFIECAKDARIDYIVIIERSTALMDNIITFVKDNGCIIAGVCDVTYKTFTGGDDITSGIVLKIN